MILFATVEYNRDRQAQPSPRRSVAVKPKPRAKEKEEPAESENYRTPGFLELTPEEREHFNNRFAEGLQKKRDAEAAIFTDFQQRAQQGDAEAQCGLGDCYQVGRGCEMDLAKARDWYDKSAEQGNSNAHYGLGTLDFNENKMESAATHLFKAAEGFLKEGNRAQAERAIEQIVRAGKPELAMQLVPALQGQPMLPKTGTGWFGPGGYIITCYHAVSLRNKLFIESDSLPKTPVTIVQQDPANDLAVLKLEDLSLAPAGVPLAGEPAQLGQQVFTIGFPMMNVMGKSMKVTDGSISATTGVNDNPRDMQISVPVQAGNSGGPLMNMRGEVVGIVASTLDAGNIAKMTGDLAQNLN